MKTALLSVLLLLSVSSHAQEKKKILDCMQPVFLDDPRFQQGSEKFFDINLVDGKLEVKLTTGDLRKELILSADTNTTAKFRLEDGTLYGAWSGPQSVQLVLRDFGPRWRGALIFPQGFQGSVLKVAPGGEIILACVLKP